MIDNQIGWKSPENKENHKDRKNGEKRKKKKMFSYNLWGQEST